MHGYALSSLIIFQLTKAIIFHIQDPFSLTTHVRSGLHLTTLSRSMDQILYLAKQSLVCASVTIIVVGVYLLIPPRTKITLTGPKDGIKLVNGLTVLGNVDKWCMSLKDGFKPSWWLPKLVIPSSNNMTTQALWESAEVG